MSTFLYKLSPEFLHFGLHLAGTDVQDIFYTLLDTGDAKYYKKAMGPVSLQAVPPMQW